MTMGCDLAVRQRKDISNRIESLSNKNIKHLNINNRIQSLLQKDIEIQKVHLSLLYKDIKNKIGKTSVTRLIWVKNIYKY